MRVLVAGASGVLGRPTVRLLREAGHEVVGLVRSDEAAAVVRALGAKVARGDLLDAEATEAAARGAEAVVNLAGALPTAAAGEKPDWGALTSVWRDGARNLVETARRGDVQIFVQASLGLVYGDHGDAWVTEDTALPRSSPVAAAREAEAIVAEAASAGLPTVILRLGTVYSPEAWHTQLLVSQARRGALAIVGDGSAYWSTIHADDAGAAIARAVDDAEAGAVYNVCDDRPTRMADLFGLIARLAGASAPSRVPSLIARAVLGSDVVSLLTTSVRLSNRAIRQDLELTLTYPTAEEGLRAVMSRPLPDPT